MLIKRFVTLGLALVFALLATWNMMAHAVGSSRFTVSPEVVIKDSQTGLEWVVGPDNGVNYSQAEAWVKGCKISGGVWRMPTMKELEGLYSKGIGKYNMDPAFKTTSWFVWASAKDSLSGAGFHFGFGGQYVDASHGGAGGWGNRANPKDGSRVFGVRSASK